MTTRICLVDVTDERLGIVQAVPVGVCDLIAVEVRASFGRDGAHIWQRLLCRRCRQEWWEAVDPPDVREALARLGSAPR